MEIAIITNYTMKAGVSVIPNDRKRKSKTLFVIAVEETSSIQPTEVNQFAEACHGSLQIRIEFPGTATAVNKANMRLTRRWRQNGSHEFRATAYNTSSGRRMQPVYERI